MYDLIIIGGGPAAMAAAFYAAGKQLHVLTIYEDLGGKIGWLQSLAGPSKEHYLPGNELMQLLTMRGLARDDAVLHDRVERVKRAETGYHVETHTYGALEAYTVLIATGAAPLMLNVPGAQRFAERGLGYSVTTYAHLLANQRVAVIGDTLRALSGAAEAASTAAQVFLLVPDTLDLTHPLSQALAQQPNIQIVEYAEVLELRGGHAVETLLIERDGRSEEIAVDRVFVALGVVPNSALVHELAAINADGFILINSYHETTSPGLFAAGDVSSTFSEQVLIAIGDGARAAMSAYDYLLARRLIPV